MSHIHFIGGEKGGVGKSVVARVLAQRFIDKGLPFAAIDGDQSSGALLRYYQEYTQTVDLGSNDGADQIMDRALGAERRVLVDLPAQSVRTLSNWLTGANILEFAREMGIKLSFWHVSDGGYASISEVDRGLDLFATYGQQFVVKNQGRGKDFSGLEASGVKGKLDEVSGKLLELPELEPTAMSAIDRLGLSFWAAIHRNEGEGVLKPMERQRVRLWLGRCYAALDDFDGAI
jgi:hypothetical protein